MDPSDFRRHGHAMVEWIAEYLSGAERYPVLPRVAPGDVRGALPDHAPEQGEPFEQIFEDFERILVPALTHWNHPGFFAYFPATTSASGVLAEFLSAALNQQAMLWRTSPASTELEEVSLAWLRRLLGLPDVFEGVIYDTASISSLHALAAARQAAVPHVREQGLAARADVGPLRIYCSEQAHSSIDKAVLMLGLGHSSLRRIPVDEAFSMRADALRAALDDDRREGVTPVAVVATIGTTSTTGVDPVGAIADICRARGIWLHVDAAYAGVTAMLPECASHFTGWEQADSIVVNPHKWLFTPFDLSAFYCRRMDVVREAFSLVPDYLKTAEGARGVRNLMDTGVQLGRRFRSLKLWMILRHFGAARLRDVLREHIRLAHEFADRIDAHPDFERLAPVPFGAVCFRAHPRGLALGARELDLFNERLLDAVNAGGDVFLSHTRLDGAFVIRIAIGHLRTTSEHTTRAWELLLQHTAALAAAH
jgi:aromatic-L-amino-acid decarboxylase